MAKIRTGRQRGRPRAFDEERALGAATHVFADKGYETASLSDLDEGNGDQPDQYVRDVRKQGILVPESDGPIHADIRCIVLQVCLASGTAREAIEKILRQGVAMVTNPDGPGACFVTQAPIDRRDVSRGN